MDVHMIDCSINLATKEKKKKNVRANVRSKTDIVSFVRDQVASFISDSRKLRREKKSAHA